MKAIVYAGTQFTSFAQGSAALETLGDLRVSTKQVERITEKIGRERVEQRNEAVGNFIALPLMDRCKSPVANPPPESSVASVMMDGGRLQILDRGKRCADASETADDDRTDRNGHWREDKIGLLMTMTSQVSSEDPCPEIPENFIDPKRMFKLASEIKGHVAGASDQPIDPLESENASADDVEHGKDTASTPKPRVRTTVATREPAQRFGEILAWAAWVRGFAVAFRKAFVADGAAVNWTIQKQWFSDYVAILDFIHALSYVFAAAMAGRGFHAGWEAYACWIQQVWGGHVEQVIAALEARCSELGAPEEADGETSPRRVVAEAMTYLKNNKDRMRYDQYRKAGLPITSSHMESTVKMFNRRVKGTEKFWSEHGAEAILQLRADHFSENQSLEEFWKNREGTAAGRRIYRRSG